MDSLFVPEPVSILILMEVTLEVVTVSFCLPQPKSFNPYSNGSYSGSKKQIASILSFFKFQSLF